MKTTTSTMFLLSLLVVGCGSGAQLVRKDPNGGQVTLQGGYMPAMGEARLVMAEHCEGRFQAIERGAQVEFRCQHAAGGEATQVLARTDATNPKL